MKVEEIMTPVPERVNETAPIREAIQKLFEVDVRHLPVVDDDDQIVGIISDRDVANFTLPALTQRQDADSADNRLDASVASLMSGDVITVGADEDVSDLCTLMIDQRIGAVPVVDQINGTIIGIVSYVDILREAEGLFREL